MKMKLHSFSLIVFFGLMFFALTKASVCPIELQEDSRCDVYVATGNYVTSCYINFTNMSHFWVRKNKIWTKVFFDIREINTKNKIENDKTDIRKINTKKIENIQTNITEIVGGTWTHIEPISNKGKEPNAFAIGNNTTINVPEKFARFQIYIWILGSVTYTNDSQCFSESLTTTTIRSTGSSHITTTQSTDSTFITTTQSIESIDTQTTDPPREEASAGFFQKWWLYVVIGILLTIVLMLAVIMTIQKRRNKLNANARNDDALTLSVHSGAPQIPDFYGNTTAEENIYEEPEMYNNPNIYENGKENACGQVVPLDLGTRRGSAHDSENSLYGCVTGRDLQA
ncbi:uncharacterized protein [Palaemon carinicauda]|uniref:uncharacterized protein n=1 Tax=Palaemon carinicauda TaxID=392227 RepID=UPI0035B60B65